MKKKFLALFLAAICVISVSACAGKEGSQIGGDIPQNMDADSGENVSDAETNNTEADEKDMEGGEYEYPSENAGNVVQESTLGYSMTYDPTLFTLDDTGEADVFNYNTAESLDAPVYISVQSYPDMDAETLAEGLALQSGIDDVTMQDAYFGADGMETKNIYIEKEVEGIRQTQVFYSIPAGEGSLLVEIGGYVGMPETAEWKFEEMLGTFSLKAE